jgi:putative sigma-54 modulation protein
MDITVSSRHLTVGDKTKQYLSDKLSAVFDSKPIKISSVNVVLGLEKNRYSAEILVNMKKFNAEAKEESFDLYESIDNAVEKIETQVMRHLDKMQDHHRNLSMRDTATALKLETEDEEYEEEDFEEKAV